MRTAHNSARYIGAAIRRSAAIVALLLLSVSSAFAFTHDISADSILYPRSNGGWPIYVNSAVRMRFTNRGLSDEVNVQLIALIIDAACKLVYQDSLTVGYWRSGQTLDTTFRDFMLTSNGTFQFVGIARLGTDSNRLNDTSWSELCCNIKWDMEAVAVVSPVPNSTQLQKTAFNITASFRPSSHSCEREFTYIPVRMTMWRCDGIGGLVFQSDTVIAAMHDTSATISFPTQAGKYNFRYLAPGCYNIFAIVRYAVDGDRSNDTAFSSFTIAPNRLGDDVGVDSAVLPIRNAYRFMDWSHPTVPITVQFVNMGLDTQASVRVSVMVVTPTHDTLYRDSAIITNWFGGVTRDVHFHDFVPTPYAWDFILVAKTDLGNDAYRYDDTLRSPFYLIYPWDAAGVKFITPSPGAVIGVGVPFEITGEFQWQGFDDTTDGIPVRVEIRTCVGDTLLAYSTGRTSMVKRGDTTFISFSTLDLPGFPYQPGCYRVLMFVDQHRDDLSSNDTITSTFTLAFDDGVAGSAQRQDLNQQSNPNPFAITTKLSYTLPESGRVSLRILDMAGRIVRQEFSDDAQTAGLHSITIDMHDEPAGVYVSELTYVDAQGIASTLVRKMTLAPR